MDKIKAWSFSRYSDYKLCPAKAKYKHVLKLKEPPNDAMARGSHIHNLAEDFIKSKITKLPPELIQFKDLFQMLRKQNKKKMHGMVVEDTWAFDSDWNETMWDNWAKCWVRIKLDCAYHEGDIVLVIPDWKTGKYREDNIQDYIEQLELYALAALILHPHIHTVKPKLIYLDYGIVYPPENTPLEFYQGDIPMLKKLWAKRTKKMLNDTIFAPKPNRFCGWCHFRKANDGPCKF